MALNNDNKSLVQFGYGFNETTSKQTGMISFDHARQAIYVGNNDEAILVTSSVKDANWDASLRKLTVTKVDGSTFELDFSDVASAQGVTSLLGGLRADVSTLQDDASTLKGDVSTLKTTVGDSSNGLVKDVNDLKAAVGDNGSIDKRIEAAINDISFYGYGNGEYIEVEFDYVDGSTMLKVSDENLLKKIASDISTAIESLDSSATGNGTWVTVDASVVNGKLVEINVNDSSVETLVNNKISALDSSKLGEGNFVDVSVTIENGLLTSVGVDDDRLNSAITDINEEITNIKSGIAGGVHFRGVYSTLPEITEVEGEEGSSNITIVTDQGTFREGDLIIVNKDSNDDTGVKEPSVEYILTVSGSEPITATWVELGDLSPAETRLKAIEDSYVKDIKTVSGTNGYIKLTPADASNGNVIITADDTSIKEKFEKIEQSIENAVAGSVTSFGGKTGDITLREDEIDNGNVEFTLSEIADSGHELTGRVVGLGSAAFTNASAYDKAGSASDAYTNAVSDIRGGSGEEWESGHETLYGLKNYVDDRVTPGLIGDENDAAPADETIYGAKAYAKSLLTWTVL